MTKKLSDLLSQLSLARSADSHEKVLQLAESILAQKPEDQVALKAKVTALIKLDKYEAAMPLTERISGPAGKLFKGYCLYRLGRSEDLEAIEGPGRGLLHVKAQMAYKAESFEKASAIYAQLIAGKAEVSNEDSDLAINSKATIANLAWNHKSITKFPTLSEPSVSHEDLFNQACLHIAQNSFQSARVLLDKAKDLCQRLDFDLSDMKTELAPINSQIAYVNQILGSHAESLAGYDAVLQDESLDSTTEAIISNNKLASQGSENPYLAFRLFEREKTTFPDLKLSCFQSHLFQRNELAVKLQAGRTRLAKNAANRFQHSEDMAMVISILKMHKPSQAIKSLDQILEKEPGNIFVALAAIQLKLQYKKRMNAVSTLERLLCTLTDDQKYIPGLVGLAVALYDKIGNRVASLDILEKARRFWVGKNSGEHLDLIQYAGLVKLNEAISFGNKEDAQAIASNFKSLARLIPGDQRAIAGLVAVYSFLDPKRTLQYVEGLPPVESFTRDIDVEELEKAGVPLSESHKRPAESCTFESEKKKKKKRKPLLPKNLDPSKEIDPERWLPKRERSSYYSKGKKTKRNGPGGATQGGPVESSGLQLAPSVVLSGGSIKNKKKKGRK
ncbi:Signal recognition particle subunit SRP72 [Neolecta irregularis DAH-3]|uniref:Signal recognition particle subunit SRP72 n=1 Tax=Neolecta irregularis (strain DAH-3) TaxID=1198029 RepID=A0A1U7LUR7_NEOID|nr:Signal recognition particle subunit SRP72 [Neolecta irregularis DAH-3]|eukprot:OLL26323.1 Signal recognition particle subunit SRP72 [Neolecta irregularis DAH-3]